jgi:hypothetical protein
MIGYFDELLLEEQEAITEVIQLLYRQTYLLERKFDKRSGRLQYVKEYRTCSKHMDFLKEYFRISGMVLEENIHMGVIYLQGTPLLGERLGRLTTIYLLILKLIYDEQMAMATTSSHIVTTIGAVNGKAGEFRVLKSLPSTSEMRKTLALLKKYQMIDPLDPMEEWNENTRIVIYPCVHAVLMGDAIRELLQTFTEEENRGEESELPGDFEDLSE